jgi:hypothetical protein
LKYIYWGRGCSSLRVDFVVEDGDGEEDGVFLVVLMPVVTVLLAVDVVMLLIADAVLGRS